MQLAFSSTVAGWPDNSDAHTFALVEGARIPRIAEILETDGLEYGSLFQGAALDELAAVAPWIVRLDPEERLSERFLTPALPDGPHWHYWGRGAVTILRSDATLSELIRHFRKYTRIFDEARGKWNYFRFYAPESLRGLVAHMEPTAFKAFVAPLRFMITESGTGQPLCLGAEPARISAYLESLPPC